MKLYDLSCTENQRSSCTEANRRSLLWHLQFQLINLLFQPLSSNSILSDALFSTLSNHVFVCLKHLFFFPSTVKILAHTIEILLLLLKNIVILQSSQTRLFIFKILIFVLFRRKGNVLISQRVLLAHTSTLLKDLDMQSSVCLDLDTKPKLSTNNVCWNNLRSLTKAGLENYEGLVVMFIYMCCSAPCSVLLC